MRWLLLEKVTLIEKGKKAVAQSRVPDTVFSTELLLTEMMAQTGGLLLGAEIDYQEDLIFAKIESAFFEPALTPGTPLTIEAVSENLKKEGAWIDSIIWNAGQKAAESRFLLMNVGKLVKEASRSITFHDAFMDYFKIREKLIA